MIDVRVASESDLPAVHALFHEGRAFVEPKSDFFKFGNVEMMEPFVERGDVLIAEYRGEPAGMVSVLAADDWWYVVALIVTEKCRGLGVAAKLLFAARALGRSRGATRGVATAAPELVDFYAYNGFKPVATVMEYA